MGYTPCHAEEADRLTKHLLPINTVQATDSSTPLRSAQNDSALMTIDQEVTHDVLTYIMSAQALGGRVGFVYSSIRLFALFSSIRLPPHKLKQLWLT